MSVVICYTAAAPVWSNGAAHNVGVDYVEIIVPSASNPVPGVSYFNLEMSFHGDPFFELGNITNGLEFEQQIRLSFLPADSTVSVRLQYHNDIENCNVSEHSELLVLRTLPG